jgi:hypothetical protein
MIVISYGGRKSGSTLAFEMAKVVLELNGHPQDKLADDLVDHDNPRNVVRHWSDDLLLRLIAATKGRHVVVKTHHPPDPLTTGLLFDALDSRDVSIHVVFRDPRDTVLSMLDHGARARALNRKILTDAVGLDSAIARLQSDLKALRRWGAFPSLKLLYDEFAFDPAVGPKLIAGSLGVAVDPGQVWGVLNGRQTKRNVARPFRYRSEMSPEDAARIEHAVSSYLRLVEHDDRGWFQHVDDVAPPVTAVSE